LSVCRAATGSASSKSISVNASSGVRMEMMQLRALRPVGGLVGEIEALRVLLRRKHMGIVAIAEVGTPWRRQGFVDLAEVQKDRAPRGQLLRFAAELETLAGSVDDTVQLVASEVWMADLAYYQSVREAAHRGRDGAQDVFGDLRQRFPGPRANRLTPAPAAV
jgi:hypothetical protein